jgi:hypothetical protein
LRLQKDVYVLFKWGGVGVRQRELTKFTDKPCMDTKFNTAAARHSSRSLTDINMFFTFIILNQSLTGLIRTKTIVPSALDNLSFPNFNPATVLSLKT